MRPPGTEQSEWESWLAAEAEGSSDAAESNLRALFAELDEPGPAPGFADRVVALALAEAAQAPVVAERSRRRWGWILLAAAGLAAAVALPVVPVLAGMVSWSALPGLLVRTLAWLIATAGSSVGNWLDLVAVLRPVARALARPQVVAALACLAVVSSLALATLVRTLERGKGAHHVPSFG